MPIEWPSREQWAKQCDAMRWLDDNEAWEEECERREVVEEAVEQFFDLLLDHNIVPSPELQLDPVMTALF